jgi:hypothetical protein
LALSLFAFITISSWDASTTKVSYNLSVDFLSCELGWCHNPNLGFTTKERAYKGAGQEWSLGVTFHAPRSVGECEGMSPHTPKWAPTLGIRISMDSQIFRGQL